MVQELLQRDPSLDNIDWKVDLAESVYIVVLQESIPAQIRQLIFHYY